MLYISLNKKSNRGYCWKHTGNVYACGYAYIDGMYIEGKDIAAIFVNVDDDNTFIKKILMLNGIFSILIRHDDKIFASVDKLGVFKLFYCHKNNNFHISNDAGEIVKEAGLSKINKSAVIDWYYAGFSAKNETLFTDLYSLNASKILLYDICTKKIKVQRYNSFTQSKKDKNYEILLKRLRSVFNEVRDRFISSIDDKKIIIPLSGGVDSRLGALMLKDAGYTNVMCCTYGNINDKESKIAKETADMYGFEHIFIPYEKHQWRKLFKSSEVHDYIKYASHYKATPHYNDFFAAKYLSERFNPDECIIVPGHIGSIAESYMEQSRFYSKTDIIRLIIEKYFYYFGTHYKKGFNYLKDRVGDYFPELDDIDAETAHILFNDAAYDTYRSCHLFKALKPYEFFGFKWRLPIMDDELVQFFQDVPLQYKAKTKILLSDFVLRESSGSVPIYKEPTDYLGKVIRNLKDKRFYCINPIDVFKLRRKEYKLPGIHRILYRYYRNYLSYAASRTLRIIMDDINND